LPKEAVVYGVVETDQTQVLAMEVCWAEAQLGLTDVGEKDQPKQMATESWWPAHLGLPDLAFQA